MKLRSGKSAKGEISFDTAEGNFASLINSTSGKRYALLEINHLTSEECTKKDLIAKMLLNFLIAVVIFIFRDALKFILLGRVMALGAFILFAVQMSEVVTLVKDAFSKKEDVISQYRYHAAEHILYNYYFKKKVLPASLNDVKNNSMFCRECGSNLFGNFLECEICILLWYFLQGPSLVLLAIYFFFAALRVYNITILGLVIQKLALRKPRYVHLDTAKTVIYLLEFAEHEDMLLMLLREDSLMKSFMKVNRLDSLTVNYMGEKITYTI